MLNTLLGLASDKAQTMNKTTAASLDNEKALESWIWDAACSIRGAKDAPKYKDYILPLIFTKRLCDVFDDELNRTAVGIGSREQAFKLVAADRKNSRFIALNYATPPNITLPTRG